MDKMSIIKAINESLEDRSEKRYSDYYIGITKDIEQRLFIDHKVSKTGHWYIYAPADNHNIAREVEKHFLERGMEGGKGGGDKDSVYVYCYLITENTIE